MARLNLVAREARFQKETFVPLNVGSSPTGAAEAMVPRGGGRPVRKGPVAPFLGGGYGLSKLYPTRTP